MKEIPLTKGYVALVDDADFDALNVYSWFAVKEGQNVYATRSITRADGSRTRQYMHRFLMPGVRGIDHRDGRGVNNQRKNIRPATKTQNAQGFQRKRASASSNYRGVAWDSNREKWMATIRVNRKGIFLGRFSLEVNAACAYDTAARKHFGEFATPNFV